VNVGMTKDTADREAATPAPEAVRSLYRLAFKDYGLRALSSSRPVAHPSMADALAITETLRVEGGVSGRRLAERIILPSRAAVRVPSARPAPARGAPEP
jgi:hypothetical protein